MRAASDAQLLLGARRGQRGVADVVLEVEARVVDPHRPPGLDRRERELLAVARDEVQPPADLVDEVDVAGRRPVEDHHRADVHVRRRPLLREEGRVHRGQPITVSLRHEADPIVRRMVTNDKRSIGSHGLEATPLGLGCMGMSEFYGTADEGEAVRTIHRALELGVTLLDTADMYGPFTNEKLVGRAVREWSGERPLIATKFGNVRGENGEFLGIRGDADYVRKACEASLQRLGVDTSTSTTSTASTRRRRSRRPSARWPSWCRRARSATSGSPRRAPRRSARRRGAPDRGAAVRVLAVGALGRGGDPPDRARARPRLRRLLAARPRLPDRQDPLGRRPRGERRAPRQRFPRFQRENLEANLALVEQVEAVAQRHGADAGPGRPRVGALARRRRHRDPGHQARRAPGGEPRRARARAHRRGPRRARRPRRRPVAGSRYAAEGMQTVGR